jgi:peptidoglycan hydrolase-like protein with peptidoglycan-binding domain
MMVKRWVPFAVAAVVLAGAVASGVAAQQGGGGGGDAGASGTSAPSASSTSASAPPVAQAAVATDPTPSVAKVPLDRTLVTGEAGDDVTRLQQRLVDMAFDPGPVDGQFGPATQAAVWAYQKLVVGLTGTDVTGKVTPDLWDRMQDPITIHPLRPNASATHMEIYLPSQTAIVFDGDKPRLITHISSGTGQAWCENGFCSVATTPGGVYQFGRRVDGWDDSVLGQLYNPVYFNYGIAVHGAYNVPLYPASHSCVRIPMHIAKYFPTLVKRGDDVFVFDGKKEPEAYGAQPPPFNTKDPNATTTTEATTTTVPKTTTTAKGATTTAPKATTTVPGTPTTPPSSTAPATTAAPTTVATSPATSATTAVAAAAPAGGSGP